MLDLSKFHGTKQAFIAAVQSGALTIETKQYSSPSTFPEMEAKTGGNSDDPLRQLWRRPGVDNGPATPPNHCHTHPIMSCIVEPNKETQYHNNPLYHNLVLVK